MIYEIPLLFKNETKIMLEDVFFETVLAFLPNLFVPIIALNHSRQQHKKHMKFSTLVVFMLLYTVKYVQDSPTVCHLRCLFYSLMKYIA